MPLSWNQVQTCLVLFRVFKASALNACYLLSSANKIFGFDTLSKLQFGGDVINLKGIFTLEHVAKFDDTNMMAVTHMLVQFANILHPALLVL